MSLMGVEPRGRENNGAKIGETRATFGLMQLKSAPCGVFVTKSPSHALLPLFPNPNNRSNRLKFPFQIFISREFFSFLFLQENLTLRVFLIP